MTVGADNLALHLSSPSNTNIGFFPNDVHLEAIICLVLHYILMHEANMKQLPAINLTSIIPCGVVLKVLTSYVSFSFVNFISKPL